MRLPLKDDLSSSPINTVSFKNQSSLSSQVPSPKHLQRKRLEGAGSSHGSRRSTHYGPWGQTKLVETSAADTLKDKGMSPDLSHGCSSPAEIFLTPITKNAPRHRSPEKTTTKNASVPTTSSPVSGFSDVNFKALKKAPASMKRQISSLLDRKIASLQVKIDEKREVRRSRSGKKSSAWRGTVLTTEENNEPLQNFTLKNERSKARKPGTKVCSGPKVKTVSKKKSKQEQAKVDGKKYNVNSSVLRCLKQTGNIKPLIASSSINDHTHDAIKFPKSIVKVHGRDDKGRSCGDQTHCDLVPKDSRSAGILHLAGSGDGKLEAANARKADVVGPTKMVKTPPQPSTNKEKSAFISEFKKPKRFPPPPLGYYVRLDYSSSEASQQILKDSENSSMFSVEEPGWGISQVQSVSLVKLIKKPQVSNQPKTRTTKLKTKSIKSLVNSNKIAQSSATKGAAQKQQLDKAGKDKKFQKSNNELAHRFVNRRWMKLNQGKHTKAVNKCNKAATTIGLKKSTNKSQTSPVDFNANNNALADEIRVVGEETEVGLPKGSATSVQSSEQFFSVQTDNSDTRSGDGRESDVNSAESMSEIRLPTVPKTSSQNNILSGAAFWLMVNDVENMSAEAPPMTDIISDCTKNALPNDSIKELGMSNELSVDVGNLGKSLGDKADKHMFSEKGFAEDEKFTENKNKKKGFYLELESSLVKKVTTTTVIKETRKPTSEKLTYVPVSSENQKLGSNSALKSDKNQVGVAPRLTRIVKNGEPVELGVNKQDSEKQNWTSDSELGATNNLGKRRKRGSSRVHGNKEACRQESEHKCEVAKSDECMTVDNANLPEPQKSSKSLQAKSPEVSPSFTDVKSSQDNEKGQSAWNSSKKTNSSKGSSSENNSLHEKLSKAKSSKDAEALKSFQLFEKISMEPDAVKSESTTVNKNPTPTIPRKRSKSLNSQKLDTTEPSKNKISNQKNSIQNTARTTSDTNHLKLNVSKMDRKKGRLLKSQSMSPSVRKLKSKKIASNEESSAFKPRQKSKGRKKRKHPKKEPGIDDDAATSTKIGTSASPSLQVNKTELSSDERDGESDELKTEKSVEIKKEKRRARSASPSRAQSRPRSSSRPRSPSQSLSPVQPRSPGKVELLDHDEHPKTETQSPSLNTSLKCTSSDSDGANGSQLQKENSQNRKMKEMQPVLAVKARPNKDLKQAEEGWNNSPFPDMPEKPRPAKTELKRTKVKYLIVKANPTKTKSAMATRKSSNDKEESSRLKKASSIASDTELKRRSSDVPEKNTTGQGKSVQFSESTEEHIRTNIDDASDWEMDSLPTESEKTSSDHIWEDQPTEKLETRPTPVSVTASSEVTPVVKQKSPRPKPRSRPVWLKKAPKSQDTSLEKNGKKPSGCSSHAVTNISSDNLLKAKKQQVAENLLKPKKCNIEVSIPMASQSESSQKSQKKTKVAYSSMLNNILLSIPFKRAERQVIAKVGTPVDIKEITEGSSVDANDYAKALRYSPQPKKSMKLSISTESKRTAVQESDKKGNRIPLGLKKTPSMPARPEESGSCKSLASNDSYISNGEIPEPSPIFSFSTDIDEASGIKPKAAGGQQRRMDRRLSVRRRPVAEIERERPASAERERRPGATQIAIQGDLMEMNVLNFGLTWALHGVLQRLPFFNNQDCESERVGSGDIPVGLLQHQLVERV